MNDDALTPIGFIFAAIPVVYMLFNAGLLGMSFWARIDHVEDLEAKRRQGINGVMEIVGLGNIRRVNILIYIACTFIAVGVISLLGANGLGIFPPLVGRLVVGVAATTIPGALLYDQIQARLGRLEINRKNRPAAPPVHEE